MNECAFCKAIIGRTVPLKYIGGAVGGKQLYACPECRMVYQKDLEEIEGRKNDE